MLRLLPLLSLILLGVNSLDFPIVLPPFGTEADVKQPDAAWGTCLLYLEAVNVIVYNTKEKTGYIAHINSDSGNTYTFDKSYVKCANITKEFQEKKTTAENSFTLDITLKEPVGAKDKDGKDQFIVNGPIKIVLDFTTFPSNIWGLTSIKLDKDLSINSGAFLKSNIVVKSGTTANVLSVKSMAVGGFNGYNFACSNTKFSIFKVEGDYELGISFGNIQVQNDGYVVSKDGKTPQFTHNVNDCVGTFSSGSWMGILVTLLLGSVLIFGFLMLNSVQTTDRFDDPKQKQLIINSKD